MWETLTPPGPERTAEYYASGWWRGSTFVDDLAARAADRADHLAIIGYKDGQLERALTYAELARLAARLAGALTELGVGRDDAVVLYLPNRWMLTALYLACNQIGAITSPVIPVLGGRELAYVLETSKAKVCVTVDDFAGTDYAARLADAAPDSLEHQVIVGDAARTGAISFDEFFLGTPWEERYPTADSRPGGPDEPSLLLYTSGTTGQMKAVVHSQNTLFSSSRAMSVPYGLTADDVITIPHYLTHMAGAVMAAYMPLMLGATAVLQDTSTDMELLLDIMAEHRVTFLYAAPGYVVRLLAVNQARRRDTAALRNFVSGSAPIQPQLIAAVRDEFGVALHALWGMTENGSVTMTRPDDPPGWAACSDGRPVPFMQVKLVSEVEDDTDPAPVQASSAAPVAASSAAPAADGPAADGPAAGGPEQDRVAGRLLVRGSSQCLGYLGQKELYDAALDAQEFFDTGDLAYDDGRGGIRITGRRVDLITRASGQKVSTLEVEAVLMRHPAVTEAVLFGYPDPDMPGADLVCAVVLPEGAAPTLEELHAFLEAEKMARVLWPDRLEFARELPRTPLGKVRRNLLRERIETSPSRGQ